MCCEPVFGENFQVRADARRHPLRSNAQEDRLFRGGPVSPSRQAAYAFALIKSAGYQGLEPSIQEGEMLARAPSVYYKALHSPMGLAL